MNNSKYRFIPVTKPNTLSAAFLSNHDRNRFYLNCFCNFQLGEKLKQHQKFEIVLNKETNKMKKKYLETY